MALTLDAFNQLLTPPDAKAVTGPGVTSWMYGTPVHALSRDPNRLMAEAQALFHMNGWVAAAERALGGRFVRMSWHLEDENGDTVDERSEEKFQAPLRLLQRPSLAKTRAQLWGITFRHMGLPGNGFWYLDQRDQLADTPLAIIYINPARMTPATDSGGNVTGWVLDHPENQVLNRMGADYNRQGVPLTTEEVIHFPMDEPDWGVWGIGWVESAQRKIELDRLSDTHGGGVLGSGGRLAGLITPKPAQSVTDDQWVQFVRDWRSITSDPDAAKRLQIAKMPLDFTQMTASLKDLQYIDITKQTKEDILAMAGVPLSQLGINVPAGLNADRSEADDAAIWETIKQRSETFREKIQYELLDRWQALGVKLTLIFDYPTFDDDTPKYEALSKAVYGPLTNDQRLNILGMEPMQDEELGKQIWVHQSLVRIDEEPEPEVPVPPPFLPGVATAEETEVIEGKARFAESFGTVRGRITKKWEKRLQAVIDRVLKEQQAYIIDRAAHIARKPSDASWWNPKRENQRFLTALDNAITEFGREVADKSRSLTRVTGVAKADPMMYDAILNNLKQEVGARITNINDTTRDAVRQTVGDYITGGTNLDPSPTELAGLIRGATMQNGQPVFGEYRSELISRTESAHLYNQAALGTYRELGVEEVEAIDGTHDEACAARNGKRFLASEAQGITDHPNGTLDWIPVVNEDRRRPAEEEQSRERGTTEDVRVRAEPMADAERTRVQARLDKMRPADYGKSDPRMTALARARGYDGLPQVLRRSELDKFVARGETEFFRGISGDGVKYAEQYRTGSTVYQGSGVYGNGTYSAIGPRGTARFHSPTNYTLIEERAGLTSTELARDFAISQERGGAVMRGTLRSDARVWTGTADDLQQIDIGKWSSPTEWATAEGYDAVIVKGGSRTYTRIQGQYAEEFGDQMIILNRSAVRVQVEDVPW